MITIGEDEDVKRDHDREVWARTMCFLLISLCMIYLLAHMVAAELAGRW
jgi:hypothetical protein